LDREAKRVLADCHNTPPASFDESYHILYHLGMQNYMARHTPAAQTFRENVRAIIDERQITMTELAELVGTSRAGISRILSGADGVTLTRAERIATQLGVELASLLSPRKKVSAR